MHERVAGSNGICLQKIENEYVVHTNQRTLPFSNSLEHLSTGRRNVCTLQSVGWTGGSQNVGPRPVVSVSPDIFGYLLLCNKLLLNLVALNTNKLVLFHTVPVGQEFRSDLVG